MPNVRKGTGERTIAVRTIARDVRAPRAFTVNAVHCIRSELSSEKLNRSARQRLLAAESLLIVFVTIDEMKALNAEFRRKDRPTDILSFASVEAGSLGELVIAMEVIRRQALEHEHSVRTELGYMLLHGILHLLGYDHGARMFAIQDRIFARVQDVWT